MSLSDGLWTYRLTKLAKDRGDGNPATADSVTANGLSSVDSESFSEAIKTVSSCSLRHDTSLEWAVSASACFFSYPEPAASIANNLH